MKISELIEELNRLKDEHGDLEVKYHGGEKYEDIVCVGWEPVYWLHESEFIFIQ